MREVSTTFPNNNFPIEPFSFLQREGDVRNDEHESHKLTLKNIKKEILRTFKKQVYSFSKSDVEGFVSTFSKHAILSSPIGKFIGREIIAGFAKYAFNLGLTNVTIGNIEVLQRSNDRFVLLANRQTGTFNEEVLFVFRKENKRFVIIAEIVVFLDTPLTITPYSYFEKK